MRIALSRNSPPTRIIGQPQRRSMAMIKKVNAFTVTYSTNINYNDILEYCKEAEIALKASGYDVVNVSLYTVVCDIAQDMIMAVIEDILGITANRVKDMTMQVNGNGNFEVTFTAADGDFSPILFEELDFGAEIWWTVRGNKSGIEIEENYDDYRHPCYFSLKAGINATIDLKATYAELPELSEIGGNADD